MKKHNGITNNILDLIGDTPLVRLNKITKELDGQFLAKYEAYNPGHSMKDRIAEHIVEQAEKKGILKKGSKVIETLQGIQDLVLHWYALSKDTNVFLQ